MVAHGISTLNVQIAFGVDPLNAADPVTFTDITSEVQRISISRGHQNRWDPFSPGTCTIELDDTNFGFDPIAVPNLVPMSPISISLQDSGGTRRWLFAGFVKPKDGMSAAFHNNAGTIALSCFDSLGYAGTIQLPSLDPSTTFYDAYHPGDLITLFNSSYGPFFPSWHITGPTAAEIDTGLSLFGPVTPNGGDAASWMAKVAQDEGGAVYVAADGHFIFDARHAWFAKSRQNTSQATFNVSGAAGDIDFNAGWMMGAGPTFSSATVSTQNDPDIIYSFSNGVSSWGDLPFSPITGSYLTGAAEADALVERLVDTSQPDWYALQVTSKPIRNDATLDVCIQRELRDFVTVTVPVQTGPLAFQSHVESINHEITLGTAKDWTTTLGLSNRTQLLSAQNDSGHLFILDDATTGKLDGSRQLVF